MNERVLLPASKCTWCKKRECGVFYGELGWGKAIVAYTEPQKWRQEGRERLRGKGD